MYVYTDRVVRYFTCAENRLFWTRDRVGNRIFIFCTYTCTVYDKKYCNDNFSLAVHANERDTPRAQNADTYSWNGLANVISLYSMLKNLYTVRLRWKNVVSYLVSTIWESMARTEIVDVMGNVNTRQK